MMKLKLICFALTSLVFWTSCQKEISGELGPTTPVNVNWNSTTPLPSTHVVTQLLKSLQPAEFNSSFLNNIGTISFLGDVNVEVPSNCFVRLNNTAVTGTIDLKIKKATKYVDMIYYGLGTLTNSELLSTDGMVNLEAKQGNDILKVAPGKKIEISFLKTSNNNYKGFAGVENNNTSNNISWNVNNQWQTDTAFFNQQPFTKISIDSCQWINCDYFYNQGNANLTSIYLKLPTDFGNVNTICYMVFRTDKVLCGMYADAVNQRYFQGTNYKVPVGKSVRLFAVSKKDNKIYYGSEDVIIGVNQTVNIATMTEVSVADLQTKLNAL
jgi:hypothetical protein